MTKIEANCTLLCSSPYRKAAVVMSSVVEVALAALAIVSFMGLAGLNAKTGIGFLSGGILVPPIVILFSSLRYRIADKESVNSNTPKNTPLDEMNANPTVNSVVSSLPKNILTHIFSFVPSHEVLKQCILVNKSWYSALHSNKAAYAKTCYKVAMHLIADRGIDYEKQKLALAMARVSLNEAKKIARSMCLPYNKAKTLTKIETFSEQPNFEEAKKIALNIEDRGQRLIALCKIIKTEKSGDFKELLEEVSRLDMVEGRNYFYDLIARAQVLVDPKEAQKTLELIREEGHIRNYFFYKLRASCKITPKNAQVLEFEFSKLEEKFAELSCIAVYLAKKDPEAAKKLTLNRIPERAITRTLIKIAIIENKNDFKEAIRTTRLYDTFPEDNLLEIVRAQAPRDLRGAKETVKLMKEGPNKIQALSCIAKYEKEKDFSSVLKAAQELHQNQLKKNEKSRMRSAILYRDEVSLDVSYDVHKNTMLVIAQDQAESGDVVGAVKTINTLVQQIPTSDVITILPEVLYGLATCMARSGFLKLDSPET